MRSPTARVLVAFALPLAFSLALSACDRPPSADEAIYQRAHDAGVSRRDAEAETLYRQLLAEHPGSRYVPDAHLALAELHFTSGDFTAAARAYGEVLAYPEVKTWGYALYKQGWCHLNLGQPREAMAIFERVIGLEGDDRVPADRRAVLVREARRDLVKAYAAAGSPGDPAAYLERWGGQDSVTRAELLERLGELHFEAGRLGPAADVYRDLIAAGAGSPRLCVWQNMLVRVALSRGTAADARKEQVGEVQRLGAVLARLEQDGRAPAAVVDACRATLRDTLKEMALLAHKQAQKEKAPALFEIADPLYRQYLARFRAEKDGAHMGFYYAEMLWSLGRFAESAAEYQRVLERDPTGPLAKEAAYALVLATKNALAIDDQGRKTARAPAPSAPGTLPPAQQKLIAAFDLYLKHVTTGPEVSRIKYRKARTLYDHGLYAAAAPLFRALVEQHPDDDLAAFAVSLELDALNVLRKSDEVCARARAHGGGAVAARDGELARQLARITRDCARPRP